MIVLYLCAQLAVLYTYNCLLILIYYSVQFLIHITIGTTIGRIYLSFYTALVKRNQCVTMVQPMVERLRNRPLYKQDIKIFQTGIYIIENTPPAQHEVIR